MDIRFILVSPALPENTGAAARAIKTMGFSSLSIVASAVHHEEKALWTAHGSQDILSSAKNHETLKEALTDRDFIIGTTARRRGKKREYYPPQDLPRLITEKGSVRPAIVFGCEESGLSNKELELCDCVSSIPLAAAYPSLNLAQAVMLYAYILSPLGRGLKSPLQAPTPQHGAAHSEETFRALKDRAALILSRLTPHDDLVHRRILERLAALTACDIKLAHCLCARLEKLIPQE